MVGIEGITMYSSLHCSLFMMDIFSPFPLNIMCKCTFIIHYVIGPFHTADVVKYMTMATFTLMTFALY